MRAPAFVLPELRDPSPQRRDEAGAGRRIRQATPKSPDEGKKTGLLKEMKRIKITRTKEIES